MCAGVGPLQWVFVGELLPPEYKVLAGLAILKIKERFMPIEEATNKI